MKSLVLILISLVSISASANLESRGLNFNSPTVSGKANVSDPKMGEIIFDTTNSTFYGNTDGTGSGWTALSAPTGGDAVVSSGSAERVERAVVSISSATSCSVTSQSGSWIASSSASSSLCTLTFTSGTFSADPTCVAMAMVSGTDVFAIGTIAGTTAFNVALWDVSAVARISGQSAMVICMGPK